MGVFSDLKPKNRAVRNGFDRSQRNVFASHVGRIKPVLSMATLPSSEYEIDLKQLLRTQPLQQAAFSGFSVNYDFQFVPYNQLYSSFNQFIAQRADAPRVNQPSINVVPNFEIRNFVTQVVRYASWDYLMAKVFGSYSNMQDLVLTARQAHGGDMPVLDEVPYCLAYTSNAPYDSLYLKVIDQLDLLGYGNYLPFVKTYSSFIEKWFLNMVSDSSSIQQVLVRAFSSDLVLQDYPNVNEIIASAFRNADESSSTPSFENSFGHNLSIIISNDTVEHVALWPALAYNKVFHDFYRNTYYDDRVILFHYISSGFDIVESVFDSGDLVKATIPYVGLFNVDDYTEGMFRTPSSIVYWDIDYFYPNKHLIRLLLMFNQYNRQYKKDLVTSVLPSTQFGNVSTMVSDDNFRELLVKSASSSYPSAVPVYSPPVNAGGSPRRVGLTSSANMATFKFEPALAISVLEARKADALQRFRERMLRAGDKTKDIFESHGWSAPRSQQSNESVFLGSYDGSLDINTVAATTTTETTELGQLGANGVATVNGSKIHFNCSDFGVVLCNFYVVKNAEYDAYQRERAWQLLEPFDFPYPELQNISLQPITASQVNAVNTFNLDPNKILGYLPSFMEYKTALDRIHGEFYSADVLPKMNGAAFDIMVAPGVFSDWVTPRQQVYDLTGLDYLYQQINVADNIFKQAASALPSTCPFLVNAYFDIKAVQPLTVIGLPI